MKLLVLFPSASRGGAEEYALTVATGAAKRSWQVAAAFPHCDGTASLTRDMRTKGIVTTPLAIEENGQADQQRKRRHLIRLQRTLRTLRRIGPDAVLIVLPSVQYGLGSILACAVQRIPTVVVFQYVQEVFPFGSKKRAAYQWAREQRQRWIAISRNNRMLLSRSFQVPEQEVTVVYNGVEPSTMALDRSQKGNTRARVRSDLGFQSDDCILLTVAGLRRQKGHKYLVHTMRDVLEAHPNTRWIWAGDGDLRESLEKMLVDYGVSHAVTFLGQRNDIPELLQAADLFVFPTRAEGGQSIALTEAMAAGLPIVTSDASGITEVVHHMEHAVVCRKEDSVDLLKSTLYGLEHPGVMADLAVAARQRVEDFSIASMLESTLLVVEEVTMEDITR